MSTGTMTVRRLGGKAHRLDPQAPRLWRKEATACGHWAAGMTIRVRQSDVDPADLCRHCFPSLRSQRGTG